MPAVIGFGAMRGAAIAEKARRIGIGTKAEILDVADPGPLEPRRDIAAEIELGVTVARRGREKPAAGRVLGGKARDQIGADLVARLPDHGSDAARMFSRIAPSRVIASIVASMTPAERAAPAGMRGANHAGLRVGQKHRPAIGRGDADGERAHAGDDGVGARPLIAASTALRRRRRCGEWI